MVARRRAKHAPTGETAGERSSPRQVRAKSMGCRGGLWPPAGVRSTPLQRDQRTSTARPDRCGPNPWAVGATCGRPQACEARPYKGASGRSSSRQEQAESMGCRGDLWSPAGVRSTPLQRDQRASTARPDRTASGEDFAPVGLAKLQNDCEPSSILHKSLFLKRKRFIQD